MSCLALMDSQEFEGENEFGPGDDGSTVQDDVSTMQLETVAPRKKTNRSHLKLFTGIEVNEDIENEDFGGEQVFFIDSSGDFASIISDETEGFQRFLDKLNIELDEAYEDFIEEYLLGLKDEEKKLKQVKFEKSLDETRKILMNVSESFPLPEIVPLGSGGIEFEWFGERGYRFGVRVRGENKVIYSGLYGSNESTHGTEQISDTFFSILDLNLSRLFMVEKEVV